MMTNLFLTFYLVLLLTIPWSQCTPSESPFSSKVSLTLQKTLVTKDRVNIFITFNKGTDEVLAQLEEEGVFETNGHKATALYEALSAHAAQTHANVLNLLNSPIFFITKVQSFWITNQVYVQGANRFVIDALAAVFEVTRIDEEEIIRLDEPIVEDTSVRAEWGIIKIHAPEAWAVAGNGVGAVVGIIDTGARVTHEALRGSFRGGEYSWYNYYLPLLSRTPVDGHGHGTHVTGTIAGSLGLGVAPGAKWISCKALTDLGFGSQSALTACGQFMTCPHTYNGAQSNCTLIPDVVSNSWGGGAGSNWFDPIINAWHALKIIPVFAQGNSGPNCSTANSPGDSQAGVIGVGATTSTDAIASYSSRGPSVSNTQKPDVSAPGDQIVSAGYLSDTARATMSGTSMACPHVAGLVALLKSNNKSANFALIKGILQGTTDQDLAFTNKVCNGVAENQFPNYSYGFGRVNALKAVQAI